MVRRMLAHLDELFHPVPTKIVYCYGEHQKQFEELPSNVTLVEGFPNNLNDLVRGHDNSMVVLDDMMSQCSKDQRVADLFLVLIITVFPYCTLLKTYFHPVNCHAPSV